MQAKLRADTAAGRLSASRQDIVHRAGELIPVSMTASIVYEGGRETATVGIFTDLRDRLKLERKLSDVETRLEESREERGASWRWPAPPPTSSTSRSPR